MSLPSKSVDEAVYMAFVHKAFPILEEWIVCCGTRPAWNEPSTGRLTQLDRLQRMRKGQPLPPQVDVNITCCSGRSGESGRT